MSGTKIFAFVQARMTSKRFPGKVLAPLKGVPLIKHTLDQVANVLGKDKIVLLTSDELSDNPLALYGESLGYNIFRGSLENVCQRFQLCLKTFPGDAFFRITGDSPFVNTDVIKEMIEKMDRDNWDIMTTIFPRTYPKGKNMELLRAEIFLEIDAEALSQEEQENVTPVYYNNPGTYRIVNFKCLDKSLSGKNFVVDTLEDLRGLDE